MKAVGQKSPLRWRCQAAGLALLPLMFLAPLGTGQGGARNQAGIRGLYELVLDRTGPSDPGRLWFTELGANRIGAYDLGNGQFKEFNIPRPNSSPRGLVFDRRTAQEPGAVWFTEFEGYRLGRLDVATGVITELPSLGSPAYPLDLVIDRQGANDAGRIWFSLHGMNKIGRLDLSTLKVATFDIPSPEPAPIGVFFERPGGMEQGYLWIAQASDRTFTGHIFRFDVASESFRAYELGSTQNAARQVIVDRSGPGDTGFLWVNEITGANIIRLDLSSGEIVKRGIPGNFFQHLVVVLDRNPMAGGRAFLWFSDGSRGRVGKMNGDTGATEYFSTAGGGGHPLGLVLDRRNSTDAGRIWFTEYQRDRLGMIDIGTGNLREIELPAPTSSN